MNLVTSFAVSRGKALIIACLMSLAVAVTSSSFAAIDPDTDWKIITTDHFVVVYDSRQQSLAEAYAVFAEQSFAVTAPVFGVWPEKTVLVLDDTVDIANGSATGIPYPTISAYTTLPSSLDSISDYGNWGVELLTHEYTHILNFEPATGIVRPFRWIFGSITRPNILLPRWYSEGLAVELETRLSKFGRLRSANYLSIIRSLSEEKALQKEDISRINEASIPGWPGGIRPYLMGALIWDEIIRRGGDTAVKDLNLAYSRRIPFLIDGPVKSLLGLNYADLLSETYARVEASANKQIRMIRKAGRVKESRLRQTGYFNHSPAISPDGKFLAFITREHNVDSLIMLTERADTKVSFLKHKAERAADGDAINRISWFPDSSSFVYDSVATFDRYYQRSDLYQYSVTEKKSVRITRGLRAREPVVSPDGKAIAFTQLLPGTTRLAVIKIDGSGERALYTPPAHTRISRPEFTSQEQIVFTEKGDDGSETLRVLKLEWDAEGLPNAVGEPTSVLTNFRPVHFPNQTSEGLLFVSDRNGAANLYLANADLSDARAVSNTTTRLMTGELDSATGDLYYSRLNSTGPQIYASPRSSWSKAPASLPQVGPLLDSQWPSQEPPQVEVKTESEDYNALPYMVPRYWMPYAFLIPDGAYIQAATSASDPVGRHTYSLIAAYDTLTQAPSFFGRYTNATTRVPITLSGEDINEYVYSASLRRHSSSLGLSASFFLPGFSNNWKGGLGWQWLQTELEPDQIVRQGPQVSISFSNATRRGFEISPEKGGSFLLAHTNYLPSLGNTAYGQTDLRTSYYFSKWLPQRNAIALFANATYAPQLGRLLLGRATVGGTYQNALIQNSFIMRGYGNSTFIGRSLVSATAEYRFPFSYVYKGLGTTPFFIQRWHGDVFVDALTLDGASFNFERREYDRQRLGRFFYGAGAEVKIDTTLFYHLPVQFIFGAYYGFDRATNPHGLFPFIGLTY